MTDQTGRVTATFRARLERHDPKLPRFVVLPTSAATALGLQHRVTVEGTLGGVRFTRRSIKPWGDGRYFFDVPNDLSRKAAVDVGDTIEVSVVVVDDQPPADLIDALDADPVAARAWARLAPSQQRRIVDDVLQAARPTTGRPPRGSARCSSGNNIGRIRSAVPDGGQVTSKCSAATLAFG